MKKLLVITGIAYLVQKFYKNSQEHKDTFIPKVSPAGGIKEVHEKEKTEVAEPELKPYKKEVPSVPRVEMAKDVRG